MAWGHVVDVPLPRIRQERHASAITTLLRNCPADAFQTAKLLTIEQTMLLGQQPKAARCCHEHHWLWQCDVGQAGMANAPPLDWRWRNWHGSLKGCWNPCQLSYAGQVSGPMGEVCRGRVVRPYERHHSTTRPLDCLQRVARLCVWSEAPFEVRAAFCMLRHTTDYSWTHTLPNTPHQMLQHSPRQHAIYVNCQGCIQACVNSPCLHRAHVHTTNPDLDLLNWALANKP